MELENAIVKVTRILESVKKHQREMIAATSVCIIAAIPGGIDIQPINAVAKTETEISIQDQIDSLGMKIDSTDITIPVHHINAFSNDPIVTYEPLANSTDAVYPATFMVTSISENQNGNYDLELTCANGNVFIYESEDGDWYVGDLASAIMGNNGTVIIYDDYIIRLTYSGYVGCEAWAYVGDRKYQ